MTHRAVRFDLGRPLGRRAFLRVAATGAAAGAALWTIGCGSGGGQATSTAGPDSSGSASTSGGGASPVLLTNEFVARQDNRFAVGLLNNKEELVDDGTVRLLFVKIGSDGKGDPRGEVAALLQELGAPAARQQTPSASGAGIPFYLSRTQFDEAGKWGVEISVTPSGGQNVITRRTFDVLETSQSPGIGDTPPPSENDTVLTTSDAASLCSRVPQCPLHDKVLADVLGKGRPLVVQFSSPGNCQTNFCAPELEALLQRVPAYGAAMDFVHIEVWADFAARKYRQAVSEWGLPTQPYTFFMRKDGIVADRLESIFGDQELDSFLSQLAKL